MWRSVLAVLAGVLIALGVAACGDDREGQENAQKDDSGTAPEPRADAPPGCEAVAGARSKGQQDRREPRLELEEGTTYTATVLTNCGEFEIRLDPERAPKTGGSFVELARDGFYDGLSFHRIVSGFVIQGGDPLGTGQGGPGYSVVEAPPENLRYTKGTVAMAKTQAEEPGTSGSQFFVVTGEDVELPPEYALLGEVTRGMDVVERIGVVPVGPDEAPTSPVVIRQVTVEES